MPFLLSLFGGLGASERLARFLSIALPILLAAIVVAFLWARGTHYEDQRDTARAQVTAANAKLATSNASIDLLQAKIIEMNADTDRHAAEFASAQKQAAVDQHKLAEQAKGTDALIARLKARGAQKGGPCVPVVPDDLKQSAKGL